MKQYVLMVLMLVALGLFSQATAAAGWSADDLQVEQNYYLVEGGSTVVALTSTAVSGYAYSSSESVEATNAPTVGDQGGRFSIWYIKEGQPEPYGVEATVSTWSYSNALGGASGSGTGRAKSQAWGEAPPTNLVVAIAEPNDSESTNNTPDNQDATDDDAYLFPISATTLVKVRFTTYSRADSQGTGRASADGTVTANFSNDFP